MKTRAPRPLSARDFWSASRGFSLVWLAHLGRRHGLLRALADSPGPKTPEAIARRARKDRGAVVLWCEAAEALGLLRGSGGRYSLPRGVAALLLREDRPEYLGGHLDYLALRSLDYDAFDEFFADGRPSARRPKHLLEAFGEATKWDHTAFLEVLLPAVPALRRALQNGAAVLDVGAGAGAWDFRVARAFPRSRFVGVEPDRTALRLARSEALRLGLDGRVRFEPLSAERMRFADRFDLVFLGEVLCNAPDSRGVLERCRKALRPGGYLVVAEGLVDRGAPTQDLGNALVLAMRLEFAIQPAELLEKKQLSSMARAAGFPRQRLLPAGGGFWFLVSQRPLH